MLSFFAAKKKPAPAGEEEGPITPTSREAEMSVRKKISSSVLTM